MADFLQGIIHLRANGAGGHTKEWVVEVYSGFYNVKWGRTGSALQSRTYSSASPKLDAETRAQKKRSEGYWGVDEQWFPAARQKPASPPPKPTAPKKSTAPKGPNVMERWLQDDEDFDWSALV